MRFTKLLNLINLINIINPTVEHGKFELTALCKDFRFIFVPDFYTPFHN